MKTWRKIFNLSFFSSLSSAVNIPALSKNEASEVLQRETRAMNHHHFEEIVRANLERECIEEICDSKGKGSDKLIEFYVI